MNSRPGDSSNLIRITHEEANSPHVDDLLRRQASLRGEGGITRDRGGKWYYQNWFVLMIAGALAAVAGWAVIEPYMDDLPYVQGRITRIDRGAPPDLTGSTAALAGQAYISANGGSEPSESDRRIVLMGMTKWIGPDGKYTPLDVTKLTVGQAVGAYVEFVPLDKRDVVGAVLFMREDAGPADKLAATGSYKDIWSRHNAANLLFFPIVAAGVGLLIGAADGIMCRLLRRVLLAGLIGLAIGFIGGFISGIIANLVYAPLNAMAMKSSGDSAGGFSTMGFLVQTTARSLAWGVAGMAMGLGQGLAMRSGRLLLYGFIGGLLGGLIGGALFDPLDLLILGVEKPSAHVARLVALGVIGGMVGLMIGIVERLARDAWLRMVEGPLAGKEFLVFKDVMRLGASPRAEIYLFNDPTVSAQHAIIRSSGDAYEIENTCTENPVCVNGRPVSRARLRHGDRITLGRTSFIFQRQRAE